MLGFLLNLHLSFKESLLLILKIFIKCRLRLLFSPMLLISELSHGFFSQRLMLLSSQESWRHFSSFLNFFNSSTFIKLLLLLLELGCAEFLLLNDGISRITFKLKTFGSIKSFLFFLLKLLSFFRGLLELRMKCVIVIFLLF